MPGAVIGTDIPLHGLCVLEVGVCVNKKITETSSLTLLFNFQTQSKETCNFEPDGPLYLSSEAVICMCSSLVVHDDQSL